MEVWKKYIIKGNAFFDQNNTAEAIAQYTLAINRINILFKYWFNPEEAVAALLASYHNLGDLYLRDGKVEKGLALYREVNKTLESALKTETDPSRKSAILKGHKCSYENLMMLVKRLNTEDVFISFKKVNDINQNLQGSQQK